MIAGIAPLGDSSRTNNDISSFQQPTDSNPGYAESPPQCLTGLPGQIPFADLQDLWWCKFLHAYTMTDLETLHKERASSGMRSP